MESQNSTVIRKEHPKCFPEMRRSDWKPPPHTGAVLGRNIVPCLAPSKSAKRTPRKIQRTPRATRERKELNPVKHTQRKARSFKEEFKKNSSKTIKSQITYNNSVCATSSFFAHTGRNVAPPPVQGGPREPQDKAQRTPRAINRLAPSRSAKRTPRKVQRAPRASKRRGRQQKNNTETIE